MIKIRREHILCLNNELNSIYEGYRKIIEFLNELASSGKFNYQSYTLELSENQTREMTAFIMDELSKIENAAQEIRNMLKDLASS